MCVWGGGGGYAHRRRGRCVHAQENVLWEACKRITSAVDNGIQQAEGAEFTDLLANVADRGLGDDHEVARTYDGNDKNSDD